MSHTRGAIETATPLGPADAQPPSRDRADAPGLPVGTVTFLFTDIERSSRLWEQYPAAMPEALDRHFTVLQEAITAHGGQVFKTVGDAVCAAFATATDAVAAAVSAQRALQGERWATTEPLRVRMALHTGEAASRAGDYAGPTLNRVARLVAAGHGGQVLLSEATAALAPGSLPADVSLRDLGTHHLRELTRAERIFQVLHPNLPTSFPPLRTTATRLHNLPVLLSSFIGREEELLEVRRLLNRTRLVTLTGAGGVGKTRLAQAAAPGLLDRYPDGVWLVELDALTDASLIARSVAAVLGVGETPALPIETVLADALASRRLLLLLDNCEHLIAGCAEFVERLLSACAGLRVLATSREPLKVAGESAYRVPSLAMPDARSLPAADRLLQFGAVRLFAERATAAQPRFRLSEQNAATVVQICRRLEGIPLAIELAAARAAVLSVEQIATRLDDYFRLLRGGPRTAPSRQQTLEATLDWSYALLDEREQILLRRLAVFRGGWTLEAAESICADETLNTGDVLDGLSALTDKSLVNVDEWDGAARYDLLEMVRQYAGKQLALTRERAALHDRHRDWYLALAEQAVSALAGREQERWLERVELEHSNLRAALGWSLESDEQVAGLRLAVALGRFWDVRGYIGEGRGWLEQLLAGNGRVPPALRIMALLSVGSFAVRQGAYDEAAERFRAGLALAQEIRDQRTIAGALTNLGLLARYEGEHARALTLHEESLAVARALGDGASIARALTNLGLTQAVQGDHRGAAVLLEESLRLFRDLGNTRGVAVTLGNLGRVAGMQGDYGRAATLMRECISYFRDLGDMDGIAGGLEQVAEIAAQRGRLSWAAQCLGEVEALREETRTTRPLSEMADHRRLVATIRAAMDDEAFAAAWEEGRATPLERFISEAQALLSDT